MPKSRKDSRGVLAASARMIARLAGAVVMLIVGLARAMSDAVRHFAAPIIMLGLASSGCGELPSSGPSKVLPVLGLLDASASGQNLETRCAAVGRLIEQAVLSGQAPTVSVTMLVSGSSEQPEPQLLLAHTYKRIRGEMLTQAERQQKKIAFAREVVQACQSKVNALGQGRDASPILSLLRRGLAQVASECRRVEAEARGQCLGPQVLLASDLRERSGDDLLEKRIKALSKRSRRPKSKVKVPDITPLELPTGTRLEVCGLSEFVPAKADRGITVEAITAAWRPVLGEGARLQPFCSAGREVEGGQTPTSESNDDA